MSKQYFVEVTTFASKNKKCDIFKEWAESYNHVLITTEKAADNAYAELKEAIKDQCRQLDERFKSTKPFVVDAVGSLVVVRAGAESFMNTNAVVRFYVHEVDAAVKFLGRGQGIAVQPYNSRKGGAEA